MRTVRQVPIGSPLQALVDGQKHGRRRRRRRRDDGARGCRELQAVHAVALPHGGAGAGAAARSDMDLHPEEPQPTAAAAAAASFAEHNFSLLSRGAASS